MPRVDNLTSCTGCMRCVYACSYHHTGEFSRSHSSICVDKPLINATRSVRITIVNEPGDVRTPCDLCSGEEVPLCLRFCPESVFTHESPYP